jgi:vacuolar-type H+-ATPase subunit E/Vma4
MELQLRQMELKAKEEADVIVAEARKKAEDIEENNRLQCQLLHKVRGVQLLFLLT